MILTSGEAKVFNSLVKLRAESVFSAVSKFLEAYYDTIVRSNKYMYAVGDIPVALVAHADTVFSNPPEEIFYDSKAQVYWGGANGLGADDRAGIFAILKIVRDGYRPHIIITTDEEKGCIGARALVEQIPKPFSPMKYIIELDRRGFEDCVFYSCDNDLFIKYVESFGFKEAYGSFSDISSICPTWGIAGVNLSIGYMDEHSYAERLYVSSMLETIEKVKKMLDDANNIVDCYEYIEISPITLYRKSDYHFSWCTGSQLMCHKCKTTHPDYEMFYVQEKDGSYRFWCPDCISKNIGWCDRCGEPYELYGNSKNFCIECNKEMARAYEVRREGN